MSEANRRSALAGLVNPGHHGVAGDHGPGVVLRELHPTAICQINGAPDEAELTGALAGLALEGEPTPRRAWPGKHACLLWNGPGGWLAVSSAAPPREWLSTLREALSGTDATVTDLSHARTVINVSGESAAELLLKGCPLDIEALRADDSATSLHGALTVHVHCRGKAGFDLYVYRSFGRALWEQLEEGALEFGLEVVGDPTA